MPHKIDSSTQECMLIYENLVYQQRKELQDTLSALEIYHSSIWRCIGDFNEILYQHEKDKLHPHLSSQMSMLREFHTNATPMDREVKGGRFTQFGNPCDGVVARERLKKVLDHWMWRQLYLSSIIMAYLALTFDQNPIIPNSKPKQWRSKEISCTMLFGRTIRNAP